MALTQGQGHLPFGKEGVANRKSSLTQGTQQNNFFFLICKKNYTVYDD